MGVELRRSRMDVLGVEARGERYSTLKDVVFERKWAS